MFDSNRGGGKNPPDFLAVLQVPFQSSILLLDHIHLPQSHEGVQSFCSTGSTVDS